MCKLITTYIVLQQIKASSTIYTYFFKNLVFVIYNKGALMFSFLPHRKYVKLFSIITAKLLLINVCYAKILENKNATSAADKYLELGTKKGVLEGEHQKAFERMDIGTQLKTFVPPILRPAITQHAYTLPPGARALSLTQRFATINGDNDFFLNGEKNLATFKDFQINRHLTDLDLFYGFDLNHKYLHSFTLRINIPYYDSQTNGAVHPNGQPFINLENAGSSQGIGDIGIFLKKKLIDQGNFPIGLAMVGAIFLPTGSHNDTFGSNGRITASRPTPPNVTVARGFDALQQANVDNGTWGDKRCFFHNFNLNNRSLCDGPAAGSGSPFSTPSAGPLSFAPGGANFDNAFVGDFPFNNGVFGRFANDGRLPSVLQPGTGTTSYLFGMFATRQFSANDLIGRSALHLGVVHKFVSEYDGVNAGDKTTYFASYVKPIYEDKLVADLSFIGFDKQNDSYAGKIPEPEIHSCNAADLANPVTGCNAIGDEVFLFDLVDRPDFSGGFTGNIATSLIFSPDPQLRMSLSGIFRVIEPDLGPAPESILRFSIGYAF